MHSHPSTPALEGGTLYTAWDRFVCAACAGTHALWTGETIGGAPVTVTQPDEVRQWGFYPDLGPLTCDCGRVTATTTPGAR